MKTVTVVAYPYATISGKISIPDHLTGAEINEYVDCHWDDIDLGEPELDYKGADIEIYVE